jgi:Mrp family chromosome partitioning ATPase
VGLAEWLYSASTVIPGTKPLPHVQEYVRETSTRNLSVLTAGELRLADSASLLDGATVQSLIEQIEPHYDQVIIDTPPLAGYAHGYAFGVKARGILLVLSPERTDQEVVQRVRQTLERNQIHLLGTVINGVAPEEGRTFSYYERTPKQRILLELAD